MDLKEKQFHFINQELKSSFMNIWEHQIMKIDL